MEVCSFGCADRCGAVMLKEKKISLGKKINDEPSYHCEVGQRKRKHQDIWYTFIFTTQQMSVLII